MVRHGDPGSGAEETHAERTGTHLVSRPGSLVDGLLRDEADLLDLLPLCVSVLSL